MKNYVFNYLTLILIYIVFFFVIINHPITNSNVNFFTYFGLILMTISLFFFTLARIKLGSSFQVSAAANKLIKDGIYKVIRHPIYLFGFTFIVGFIVFIQEFYGLLFLIGLILLQMKRIKKEEQVLEEQFGKEYLDYKEHTWF
ncbi:MAG: isoprenylcysteine carboxylmethyltransferase family protein [Chlorobi bacterium]|nr:isoprenylcysteine carboxylmethyltransferase family protein [Chlorobiota bacterium]